MRVRVRIDKSQPRLKVRAASGGGTPGRDISSRPIAVVETGVASAKRSEAHCSAVNYWIIS